MKTTWLCTLGNWTSVCHTLSLDWFILFTLDLKLCRSFEVYCIVAWDWLVISSIFRLLQSIDKLHFTVWKRDRRLHNSVPSLTMDPQKIDLKLHLRSFIDAFLIFKFIAVLPDFGQVYNFIGSVFDPKASNHLKRLEQMDQIDVETVCSFSLFHSFHFTNIVSSLTSFVLKTTYTVDIWSSHSLQVLLLMRNLAINLTSSDFEDHVSLYPQ